MPVDVRVEGAERLAMVARALREAGAKDLQRELRRGLNRAARPLREDAKRSALVVLPRRGGLGRRVAGSRLTTRIRTGRNPGVQIQARGMEQLRRMDEGFVVHPTFGHRPRVEQRIRPGWFTEPMQAGADEVRRELMRVLDDVAAEIARRF